MDFGITFVWLRLKRFCYDPVCFSLIVALAGAEPVSFCVQSHGKLPRSAIKLTGKVGPQRTDSHHRNYEVEIISNPAKPP